MSKIKAPNYYYHLPRWQGCKPDASLAATSLSLSNPSNRNRNPRIRLRSEGERDELSNCVTCPITDVGGRPFGRLPLPRIGPILFFFVVVNWNRPSDFPDRLALKRRGHDGCLKVVSPSAIVKSAGRLWTFLFLFFLSFFLLPIRICVRNRTSWPAARSNLAASGQLEHHVLLFCLLSFFFSISLCSLPFSKFAFVAGSVVPIVGQEYGWMDGVSCSMHGWGGCAVTRGMY